MIQLAVIPKVASKLECPVFFRAFGFYDYFNGAFVQGHQYLKSINPELS